MSSFCKQCSIEMFGQDFKELVSDQNHYDLCEGCGGYVLLNKDGECIDPQCKLHGEEQPLTAEDILLALEKVRDKTYDYMMQHIFESQDEFGDYCKGKLNPSNPRLRRYNQYVTYMRIFSSISDFIQGNGPIRPPQELEKIDDETFGSPPGA